MHLVRAMNAWAFQVGTWQAPPGVSWVAGAFAVFLSIWGFRLATR